MEFLDDFEGSNNNVDVRSFCMSFLPVSSNHYSPPNSNQPSSSTTTTPILPPPKKKGSEFVAADNFTPEKKTKSKTERKKIGKNVEQFCNLEENPRRFLRQLFS